MKWADGQIDIQKPDFMRLYLSSQYLYPYISLLICSLYTQRRIQRDFDIVDAVSAPKFWPSKKITSKKTKACSSLK